MRTSRFRQERIRTAVCLILLSLSAAHATAQPPQPPPPKAAQDQAPSTPASAPKSSPPQPAAAPDDQERSLASDYRFWLGLLGSVTGLLSLGFAYLSHQRANRAEVRLQAAEARAQEVDVTRIRSARYVRACETAAGAATDVKDRRHPEWRDLSTDLEIGRWSADGVGVIFVEATYQSNPMRQGDRTVSIVWYKWFIGIAEPQEPTDTYALFGELPRLLKRPGELVFAVDQGVPSWARNELGAPLTVAIMYHKVTMI